MKYKILLYYKFRFDWSYTRNGQATLFINKMLDRDVGIYEAIATNEHGEVNNFIKYSIDNINL